MRLSQDSLKEASNQGLITAEQAQQLWLFLLTQEKNTPNLSLTHVLYYLGGLTAIGSISLFVTLGWERFGGWGLFTIAVALALVGIGLTEFLLKRKSLPIPAGITAAFVIALSPLAVYGLQSALGWWPSQHTYRTYHTDIDWRWVLMELATLATGAIMLWRYCLPFLIMPVAVTFWYMSMDLAPFLFGEHLTWKLSEWVSVCVGLFMLILAFWVDFRTQRKKDFAFWLYLFGVLAFWGGLTFLRYETEFTRLVYLGINLCMILLGTFLTRKIFIICGGLGTAGYIGYLAYNIFKDSILFPFALTAVGFGIIYLGILWQRHQKNISSKIRTLLPQRMHEPTDME